MEREDFIENTENEKTIRDITKIVYSMCNALEFHEHGFQNQAKEELQSLLENLPEEVNVVAFSKDFFASRVKEEDSVINIWRREDVHNYIKELENGFVERPDFLHKWSW